MLSVLHIIKLRTHYAMLNARERGCLDLLNQWINFIRAFVAIFEFVN